MILKKYIVSDIKEAMIQAKYELGPESVIISQHKIVKRKWYKLSKTIEYEVVMGVEEEKLLQNENLEIEQLMARHPMYKDASKEIQGRLLGFCKLNELRAENFTNRDFYNFVDYIYENNCFKDKRGFKKINVFVGPTGVGKTTNVAKLAAREKLINNKSVGIMTIDTYKIGGIEQIKSYTDILQIPLEIAQTPSDIEEKLDRLKDQDLILIDTVGTNQNKKDELFVLKKFLDKIGGDSNVFLTLSSSTETEILKSMLQRYKGLGYNGVILTKLDELASYKKVWDLMEIVHCPIEYASIGESIPEDVIVANLENINNFIKESLA